MFEEEDNTCPYDNVEFPIRQSGTGTWPGPGSSSSSGSSGGNATSSSSSSSPSSSSAASGNVKMYGQHSLSRTGAMNRLAPLVEVDGPESGDSQRSLDVASTTSTTSLSTSVTSAPSSYLPARNQGFGSKTLSANSSSSSVGIGGRVGPSSFPTVTTTTTTTSTKTITTTPTLMTNSKNVNATSATTTTTTVSSASTTSTTAVSKQPTSKPVIPATNDSTTYIAAQVTSPNDTTLKKKSSSMKYLDAEDEDFKRHDFNPGSRLALERVYTCHPDFYQLNSKILDEGSLLKQDVLDIFRKTGETLTYEQLLQGMLVDGERFLLGGCWLYYTNVQFLDVEGTKILREPYGRGRIGLTSKRALFLSTETFTDASLDPYGEPTKRKDGGYKLEVSKLSNVVFKNIPLSNFHSAEMEVVSGTSVLTKITKRAMCCGCFGTSSTQWVATPPTTRSINSRVLRVGVSMPPWQTRMFMDIYLDPSMSLTVARDFISQLHSFAPHMH